MPRCNICCENEGYCQCDKDNLPSNGPQCGPTETAHNAGVATGSRKVSETESVDHSTGIHPEYHRGREHERLESIEELESLRAQLTRLSAEREKERGELHLEIERLESRIADLDKEAGEIEDKRIDGVVTISGLRDTVSVLTNTLADRDRQLAAAKTVLNGTVDSFEQIIENMKDQLAVSERQRKEILAIAQLAYRKHHLDDPDIGWNELGDKLCNALCNSMTDEGFQAWLKSLRQSTKTEEEK